jgi:hypothetical protein
MAKLTTEFAVNMYPLAHGNPAGKRHIAVTPLRVLWEGILCLGKQHTDPFLCHHFSRGILRSLLHEEPAGIRLCILWVSHVKKSR